MLSALFVSDLALIKRLSVDFHRGFSVLTGETGAGKSLILDSIQLFLSNKNEKALVRHGEEKLEVSLFFSELKQGEREALKEYCSSEELDEGILLTRIVFAEGKSISKINSRTVPFSRLAAVARELLTIHGQHDTGGLLDEKSHRMYLDSALSGEAREIKNEYTSCYQEYLSLKNHLDSLTKESKDEKEQLDWIDFQMKEIARVKPKRGEEEQLEEKLVALVQTEKRHEALYTADRALSGGEKGKGAIFLVQAAARKLESLSGSDKLKELSESLYEIGRELEEKKEAIGDHLAELEDSPAESAEEIRRRLDLFYRMKQKYGKSVDEIVDYYEELRERRDLTLSRKDDIKRTKNALQEAEKSLFSVAESLSVQRHKIAAELEERIGSSLKFLDMPKMQFSVEFVPQDVPNQDGTEAIRFLISANTGEGKKPLSQIASGGELSRIMLALHLNLGGARDAETMIFDEIDTGISGATAQRIGVCLRLLAEKKQIFCVTHSAQVSTLADRHYLVSKTDDGQRTETCLKLLGEQESLGETARLLGGRQVGEEARLAAQKLREEGLREAERLQDTF